MIAKIDTRTVTNRFRQGRGVDMVRVHDKFSSSISEVDMTVFLGAKHFGTVIKSDSSIEMGIFKLKDLYIEGLVAARPNIRFVICSDFDSKSKVAKTLFKVSREANTRNYERAKFVSEAYKLKHTLSSNIRLDSSFVISEDHITTRIFADGDYHTSKMVFVGNTVMTSYNGGAFNISDEEIDLSNVLFTAMGMTLIFTTMGYIEKEFKGVYDMRGNLFLWSIGAESVVAVEMSGKDSFRSSVRNLTVLEGKQDINAFIKANVRESIAEDI